MLYNLHLGDCLESLRAMPDANVDAIVTDPPYGLSFMGKKWDYDVPGVEVWAECLRVLKPGGYLLAFSGTRTYHRMAVAIEDAGFEIRDQIGWAFGSGFPKSHNGEWGGTALKPAWEPICMARKPLIGTVEANWREHGTGALNIDGCRVGDEVLPAVTAGQAKLGTFERGVMVTPERTGRWPANLIHDGSDEVLAAFPQAGGQLAPARVDGAEQGNNTFGALRHITKRPEPRGDVGSAARFFYCAKASRKDRDEGLEGFERHLASVGNMDAAGRDPLNPRNYAKGSRRARIEKGLPPTEPRANTHPTVKPTDLMRYLVRLVTPPRGVVLDPFMGSGSTGKAAILEGFRFIGCERSPEYMAIARARILDSLNDIDIA